MTDHPKIGFPTEGEVFAFMVDALGVMPGKADEASIDDNGRRALQKSLQRLKSEEGNLTKNGQHATQQIAYLVAGYLPPPWSLALGDVLFDAHDAFRIFVRDEGTVLNPLDSVRYLIANVWGPASAVHLVRRFLQFGLSDGGFPLPEDPLWFLPDLRGEKPVWPLAKVMNWVYQRARVSQTQFHYPGCNATKTEVVQRQRDLDNAQNWCAGHNLPSAAALASTFKRAFDAWSEPGHADVGRLPGMTSRVERDGVLGVLFVARVATFLGQSVLRTFGQDFLAKQCRQIARNWVQAAAEMRAMHQLISREAQEIGLPAENLPELRFQRATEWTEHLALRAREALDGLREADAANSPRDAVIAALEKKVSPLPVSLALSHLPDDDYPNMPQPVAQALGEGFDLARDRSLTAARVDAYEAQIHASGAVRAVPWIVPWLRFLDCYRRADDMRKAWEWIQQAWENGRNCAGHFTEPITAAYIEMAAKMQSKVALRTAARWAHYRGLCAHGLAAQEPTPEYLAALVERLRAARSSW